MSQTSIASYFNTRKRAAAVEELRTTRNKVFLAGVDSLSVVSSDCNDQSPCPVFVKSDDFLKSENHDLFQQNPVDSTVPGKIASTRSGRAIKRIGGTSDPSKDASLKDESAKSQQAPKQPKIVKFIKKGNLSPTKKITSKQDVPTKAPVAVFSSKESVTNIERGIKSPTKSSSAAAAAAPLGKEHIRSLVRKELSFDEVKTKVSRSAKLQELKASLGRIQELEKVRKQQEERNERLRNGETNVSAKPAAVNLKEFKTIELEVLSSPKKGLTTPTKLIPAAPDKHGLMSPKTTLTPKKLLFSPTKDGSPSKLVVPPAYQRFQNLAESGRPSLQMPYTYRCLVEMFKCLDSICAMFYNRKEIITFKKLKPAVQRMLRRNFNEAHLAQIKNLYPEAFSFSQMKMRNFGSTSKQDYYQLIISPNVQGERNAPMIKIDEDNVLRSAQTTLMNPQVIIDRQQKFYNILLNKVKDVHDKFLKSLDPPLNIPKNKVTRWHPEFDLEKCPEIDKAHLPQPPNIEKYSSAKDILSTARNLFNCSTSMERAMERFETHKSMATVTSAATPDIINDSPANSLTAVEQKAENPATSLLKGIPKSLLEKIRAKQAAKALDAMTRRPSQDQEATKYSRLPELARHLRNVFITENKKKSVLPLETVIKKIDNSYRTILTPRDIETHIKLIAKECSQWIEFHEIRKTWYLKIDRDADLGKVIERLENLANEKSK